MFLPVVLCGSVRGGAGYNPTADSLTHYSRLGGYGDRIRPARVGTPAVAVRGTPGTGVGRLGPCLSLDGSSAVAIGAGYQTGLNTPTFAGDWTLSLDFKLSALPSIGSQVTLLQLSRADTGVRQMEWVVYGGGGPYYYPQINFWLDASTIRSVRIYPPSPNLTTGTWYTICLRYTAADSSYTLDCNGQTSSVVRNYDTGSPDTTGPIWTHPQATNTVLVGSQWDASSGWQYGLNGLVESVRCHSRRLTDTEVATASAGYDPFGADTGTVMVVADPQPYQIAAKSGGGTGSVRVTGYLRGAALTPTDIQWSWNGSAWADMSATIDATARTFTGTITLTPAGSNPSDRQGTLSLRCKNSTGVGATVAGVGVGYVFGVWGQSNATGAYTNPQPYIASNGLLGGVFDFSYVGRKLEESASLYNLHASGGYAWVDGTSESYGPGSQWPRFAALWSDRTGWPVMIVPAAVAGSSIDAAASTIGGWRPTLTTVGSRSRLFNNYDTLKRRCLYVGGVTAVIGQQGEQDSSTSMSAATYTGYIEALADQVNTDLSCKLVNSLLYTGAGAPAGNAAINTGISNAAGADANVLVGPDFTAVAPDAPPHYTTDAKAITIAAAWDARLAALGYDA